MKIDPEKLLKGGLPDFYQSDLADELSIHVDHLFNDEFVAKVGGFGEEEWKLTVTNANGQAHYNLARYLFNPEGRAPYVAEDVTISVKNSSQLTDEEYSFIYQTVGDPEDCFLIDCTYYSGTLDNGLTDAFLWSLVQIIYHASEKYSLKQCVLYFDLHGAVLPLGENDELDIPMEELIDFLNRFQSIGRTAYQYDSEVAYFDGYYLVAIDQDLAV